MLPIYFVFIIIQFSNAVTAGLLSPFTFYNTNYQNFADYCSLIDGNTATSYSSLTEIDISNIPSLSHTQSSCAALFSLELESADYNRNLVFELTIQQTTPAVNRQTNLLVGVQVDSPPTLDFTAQGSITSNMVQMDTYGFFSNNSSYYLSLRTPYASSTKLYFGVFQVSSQPVLEEYVYTVSVQKSAADNIPCPQGCLGRGICQTNGVCKCSGNYVDRDCSKLSTFLTITSSIAETVEPLSWKYLMLSLSQVTVTYSQLTWGVTVTQGSPIIYFDTENNSSDYIYLPNQYNYDTRIITPSQKPYSYDFNFPAKSLVFADRIIAGVYNPSDSETCYYQINISIAAASSQVIQNTTNPTITTTSTSVIWVVASISILLCILMIGFFVVGHYCGLRRRLMARRLRNLAGGQVAQGPPGNPQQNIILGEQNNLDDQSANPVIEPLQPRRRRRIIQGQMDEDQMLAQLVQELLVWIHTGEMSRRMQLPQLSSLQPDERLNSRDIDRYLPTNLYREFEVKYNNSCTICLEDFETTSICRQIIVCHHIFHDKCIKEWLKNSQTCPNCKEELKKEKLQKAFEKRKQNTLKELRKIQIESQLNKIIAQDGILAMMDIRNEQEARNKQEIEARNRELETGKQETEARNREQEIEMKNNNDDVNNQRRTEVRDLPRIRPTRRRQIDFSEFSAVEES